MSEHIDNVEIDRVAEVIQSSVYEGYPQHEQRLYLGSAGLYLVGGTLIVPDGPWHVSDHQNRHGKPAHLLDPEVPSVGYPLVAPELSEQWRASGLLLDQYGRPVHPNWQQLLGDSRIGLPTGVGFFWRYGPNATVDPVIYRRRHEDDTEEYLLIKRTVGGQWGCAGGFVNREDPSLEAAARRENAEETHLDRIGGTAEIIMHKRSVGLRDMLNAWTENAVVLIHGDQEYLYDTKPSPGDDADDVGWFTQAQMADLDMFDAHPQYLSLAASRIRRW